MEYGYAWWLSGPRGIGPGYARCARIANEISNEAFHLSVGFNCKRLCHLCTGEDWLVHRSVPGVLFKRFYRSQPSRRSGRTRWHQLHGSAWDLARRLIGGRGL